MKFDPPLGRKPSQLPTDSRFPGRCLAPGCKTKIKEPGKLFCERPCELKWRVYQAAWHYAEAIGYEEKSDSPIKVAYPPRPVNHEEPVKETHHQKKMRRRLERAARKQQSIPSVSSHSEAALELTTTHS